MSFQRDGIDLGSGKERQEQRTDTREEGRKCGLLDVLFDARDVAEDCSYEYFDESDGDADADADERRKQRHPEPDSSDVVDVHAHSLDRLEGSAVSVRSYQQLLLCW